MEMPTTMDILYSDDMWVCDTTASNHFSKSKNGAYNCQKTDVMSQEMASGNAKVSLLMDFTVTHFTKEEVKERISKCQMSVTMWPLTPTC